MMDVPPPHSLGEDQYDLMRLLGYIYLQNGRPDKAAILFDALHALDPDDCQVAKSLACAHLRNNKPENALVVLDHLAAVGDTSALCHLLRSQSLIALGRIAEAARSMRFFVNARAEESSSEKK